MVDASIETLDIKAGAVVRLSKEKIRYENEIKKEELIQRGKGDADAAPTQKHIKAKQMLAYVKVQLLQAFKELEQYMQLADELVETKSYDNAMEVLLTTRTELCKNVGEKKSYSI